MTKIKNKPFHKGVYILPNLLTTASLFSGFLAIIWAVEGKFEHAAVAVFASAVLDGLDGKVARLTQTFSEFGVQYDSLADLVAFGVAPAVTLYLWKLHEFGRFGLMASFLIIACSALRLARFNVNVGAVSKKYFIGLPTPAQACIMASFILFTPYIPDIVADYTSFFALLLAYSCSFFMVSRVRYFSFKEYGFFKAHPFSSMVTVVLIFVLLASKPTLLGFLTLFAYLLSGPVQTYLLLRRPHGQRGATKNPKVS